MAEERRGRRSERNVGWYVLAGLLISFLRSIARYDMQGLEHVPKRGGFVLAPNHVSEFDPLVMSYVVWRAGRVPRFLAKASLFRVPGLGWLLRRTGQIPVERGGGGGDALLAAADLLGRGHGVIVYPEGTLTRDPDMWPMRGKTGAVRLALEHGVPVVPVAHWGVQAILPRWGKKLRLRPRKHVAIRVGPPLDLAGVAAQDSAAVAAATERLMDAVTGLLQGIRGGTPPAERFDPAAHGQPEFGRPDGV